MTQIELKELLSSKKTKERLKAAKEIGKSRIYELSNDLVSALEKELKDPRTWQTQVVMINSVGLLNCKDALPLIEPIIKENKEHDMVTNASSECYVRLKRETINDSKPVIELLRFGGFSIIDGCLNPLGYDRMIPPDDEINELVRLSWDLHKKKERGFTDPRYGIAAACAGWKKELTEDFLKHCLDTAEKDTPLKYVAENSLKGKYVKLR